MVRTMRWRLVVSLTVVVLAALAASLPAAYSAAKPGAACKAKDVGLGLVRVGGKDLRCVKSGKAYVWRVVTKSSATAQNQASSKPTAGQGDLSQGLTSSSQIPKVVQNWGLALAPYDPATGMAGVMRLAGVEPPAFPNDPINEIYRHIVGLYGTQFRGKTEPQMAFVAPLGTKVISMVDGTVCNLSTLWSGDFTVMVAPEGFPCLTGGAAVNFEHEHVIAPTVKVGQRVKAGEALAVVSDFNQAWKAKGFGMLEIGVLFGKNDGSGRPWHACPSLFLAPAKRAQLLQTLASIQQSWANVLGDPTLDTVSQQDPVGCLTSADLSG